ARDRRTISYPGDGRQHWNVVHRDDVAEGYRLALEHARGGQRFILVDESHHTVRELAEAAARGSGGTARSLAREKVLEKLGGQGAPRARLGAAPRLVRRRGRVDPSRMGGEAEGRGRVASPALYGSASLAGPTRSMGPACSRAPRPRR